MTSIASWKLLRQSRVVYDDHHSPIIPMGRAHQKDPEHSLLRHSLPVRSWFWRMSRPVVDFRLASWRPFLANVAAEAPTEANTQREDRTGCPGTNATTPRPRCLRRCG